MDSLRDILADNLTTLMEDKHALGTQGKIAARAKRIGTPVAQSSIGRIINKKVHTSLDILEILANVFGVNPLDLLLKDFKTRKAPTFEELHVIDLWRKLNEDDRHKLMAYLAITATTIDAEAPPALREVRNAIVHNQQQPLTGRLATVKDLAKTPLTIKEVEDAAEEEGTGKRSAAVKKRTRSR